MIFNLISTQREELLSLMILFNPLRGLFTTFYLRNLLLSIAQNTTEENYKMKKDP